MFDSVTNALVQWAQVVPIEIFTFVGSFVEEVLAPVPSPIVMTLAGSIASAQETGLMYLVALSLIGAAGKTIGAVLVYWISYKAGDILFGKFGRFIGVTKEEVMALGEKLNGGWKDLWMLLFLRALPIMSSAVVSICSGVVKIPLRVYIIATFFGTIVRDFFYLYVGFTGIETLHNLVDGFDSIESVIQTVIAVLIVIGIGWIAWKRKVRSRASKGAK